MRVQWGGEQNAECGKMKDYIKNIRKLIGHERLMIVGASVIICKNGKLLLQKRKDNGCWGYHGGCVELGETVEEAAKRELLEETGLVANSLELLGVFSGKELFYTYPHGDKVANTDVVFLCEDYTGEIITQTNETTALQWFELDKLPGNLSPPIQLPLTQCIDMLKTRYQNITQLIDEKNETMKKTEGEQQIIKLATKRLIVRDPQPTDIDAWHSLLSDPLTMYYLQDISTRTIEESKQNLEIAISEAQCQNRTKYFFAIEEKETGAFVGTVGYTVIETTPVGKIVGLGYFILPEYHGKGYMTEALTEVIRFAFEENDVFKINTGCLSENRASERVMQKCNMVKEAEFKSHIWHVGRMKDRVEYRLLRDEWQVK